MIRIRIKEMMAKRGLSAEEVEKRCGFSARSLHNYLYRDNPSPSMTTLRKLAKALDCKVIELIDEDGFYYDPERIELVTRQMLKGKRKEMCCPYCGGVFDIRVQIPKDRPQVYDGGD